MDNTSHRHTCNDLIKFRNRDRDYQWLGRDVGRKAKGAELNRDRWILICPAGALGTDHKNPSCRKMILGTI